MRKRKGGEKRREGKILGTPQKKIPGYGCEILSASLDNGAAITFHL